MRLLAVLLAPGSLNHTANIIKGFAIAIGIAIAIAFVWLWWASRRQERALELSQRARDLFAAQLRTAMQHPELAEPLVGGLASQAELVRYKQFVAGLALTCDGILALDPAPAWEATLERQLAPHKSYLGSAEFRQSGLRDCSPATRALIARLVGTA